MELVTACGLAKKVISSSEVFLDQRSPTTAKAFMNALAAFQDQLWSIDGEEFKIPKFVLAGECVAKSRVHLCGDNYALAVSALDHHT